VLAVAAAASIRFLTGVVDGRAQRRTAACSRRHLRSSFRGLRPISS
jgi:hypothetical protein